MHRSTLRVVALATALQSFPSLGHAQHQHADTVNAGMDMTGALGISMDRMGSGTTWIPDAVRLPMHATMAGSWMVMVHGWAFAQYTAQGGPRGESQFGSLNWAMVSADRNLAGGMIQFRFMPSLDPWSVGRCGYPLLLQSGETCHGAHLVDRQHPHDFFMELAALYERPITSGVGVLVYAAPAGEPALGPVAFMHRPSAMDEPQAPLGHHWQDATHITFGVLTAGVFTRHVRLEGSRFNATEPDEHRWNIERGALSSYSGRVTVNPSANWSLTAGYGVLDNPERAVPAEELRRFVTSVQHGVALGETGQWASSAIYGRNTHGGHASTSSLLFETQAVLDPRNTVLARFEHVEKSAHELDLPSLSHDRVLPVRSVSLGYIRELVSNRWTTVGIGGRGSVNFLPGDLASEYGSRTPMGAMVFLRVRPTLGPRHSGSMEGMQH